MRNIEEVRQLRGDLSTWLVHLIKGNFFNVNGVPTHFGPKDCLLGILKSDTINAVSEVVGNLTISLGIKTLNQVT